MTLAPHSLSKRRLTKRHKSAKYLKRFESGGPLVEFSQLFLATAHNLAAVDVRDNGRVAARRHELRRKGGG